MSGYDSVEIVYRTLWAPDHKWTLAVDAARLHRELLPTSPLSKLCPEFLSGYYYGALPEHRALHLAVAYIGDQAAGFIAATDDARGFYRRVLLASPNRLAVELFRCGVHEPHRLRALVTAARIYRGVRASEVTESDGELLSLGVLPEFRAVSYAGRGGATISQDLIAQAVDRLQHHGVRRVRAVVDKDNTAVRLMYASMGWRVGATRVPGWEAQTVEYLCDLL